MKSFLSLLLVLLSLKLYAQTTFVTTPTYPSQTDQITIIFDVTHQTKTLVGYTGIVYAHTGVYINNDNSSWQDVIGTWGNNSTQPQLTSLGQNKYQIVINNSRNYYGVTSTSQNITSLNFVLRSADATKQTEDIHIPLYSAGLSLILTSPKINLNYGDPMRSPVCVSPGSILPITATTTAGTNIKSIVLSINGNTASSVSTNTLNYSYVADYYLTGRNDIKITATDNTNSKDSIQFVIFKNPVIKNVPLPAGNQIGINYGSDPTKVTLAFYAPQKSFVYVIGDFGTSDWKADTTYFMNKYAVRADSVIWWKTISNLSGGTEYSYQFFVDDSLRIYDPYTEKILDANNDPYIPSTVYPNLKSYPTGKTSGLVSVLQTNQPAYSWKVQQFVRPAKNKLVIYELLVRDFVSTHWYKTIIDTLSYLKRLGVNAIELMPITEFEGNDSWGYNPTTYFAPDKYYGTKNDLKALIDACHQNGIAVIQDMVLNHAYNSNSMAQLYWDNVNNRPAANNPWFNVVSPNPVYSWGNDFNHQSKDTKYFVDRVTSFWLTEYKMDGFRFDFTKGFTNTVPQNGDDGSAYDASRIAILERMASKIWSVVPDAYVILEHFCVNSEQSILANYGMMLWGNLNSPYSQATMSKANPSWDFSTIAYNSPFLNWSKPNLVGYMESHDEERVMYNDLTNGNSNGSYKIKDFTTAIGRIQEAANLFILVPGPKMIWQFGEVGYDYSINYPSGTSNDRLTDKPIRWDYYTWAYRRRLYDTFAYLIRLKINYPAFSSTDFTLIAAGYVKSLYINHSSMNVAAFGNFDVYPQDYQPLFQSTGKWYEFFSGDSLNVTDINNTNITLQPGEYRLYTSKKINKSDVFVTNIQNQEKIPQQFALYQNYPNPFNPSTIISYQLPVGNYVTLKVYDVLGREVATLVDEYKAAGIYNSQFPILNLPAGRQGSKLVSGVYFYRLQAGEFVSTKKMILIK